MNLLKPNLTNLLQELQNEHFSVLIVDNTSLKLLNSVFKMSEILLHNISEVLLVSNFSNKSFARGSSAIFLLSPTYESVDDLVGNWKEDIRADAHILFTAEIPDNLFSRIKESKISLNLKTLKELQLNFLPVDSLSFTLDSVDSVFNMYNPSSPSFLDFEMENIANRIKNVMAMLGEYPYIRFQAPIHNQPSGMLPEHLALKIQAALDMLSRNDSSYPPVSLVQRGVLMVLERGVDIVSTLLHEFTYQALIADVLEITDRVKDENGKDNVLDESDVVWKENRHKHVAKVIEYLNSGVKDNLSQNKAGKFEKNVDSKSLDKIQDLKDAISALPEYQELKAKLSLHTELCRRAMQVYSSGNLEILSEFEQDLVLFDFSSSRIAKDLYKRLLSILDNPDIQHIDKFRLVLLYFSSVQGTTDSERHTLIDRGRFSLEETQAITNLCIFGVKLGVSHRNSEIINLYSLQSIASRAPSTHEFANSRFLPTLNYIIRDQLAHKLPYESFTWVKEPPPDYERPATWAGSGSNISTTRMKPSWATKKTQSQAPTESDSSKKLSGPRLIIFIMGGMTYSEMRSCHQIAQELGREIIIGSTHILTPEVSMNVLKDLHNPAGKRNPFSSNSFVPKSSRIDPDRKGSSSKTRVSSPLPSERPRFQAPERSTSIRSGPPGSIHNSRSGGEARYTPEISSRKDSHQKFAKGPSESSQSSLNAKESGDSRIYDRKNQSGSQSSASSNSWWKLKKK